jgi:hypothetical protein
VEAVVAGGGAERGAGRRLARGAGRVICGRGRARRHGRAAGALARGDGLGAHRLGDHLVEGRRSTGREEALKGKRPKTLWAQGAARADGGLAKRLVSVARRLGKV